jgi:hypothetical protein
LKLCARIGSFRENDARGILGQVFTFALNKGLEQSINPAISKAYQGSHYQSEGVREKHVEPELGPIGLRADAPECDCVVDPLKSLRDCSDSAEFSAVDQYIIPYSHIVLSENSFCLR